MDEWHKAAFYDPVAGVYYDYATGSDSLPDGIDFSGDPDFEAVYYDGGANDYPNPVDDVGLPSPFGTFGQAGNVKEWEESSYDLANDDAQWDDRVIRGSHWYGSYHGLAGDQSQSNRAIRGGE
jgi:formylglycine-generating enzyme required for sulfatase activity